MALSLDVTQIGSLPIDQLKDKLQVMRGEYEKLHNQSNEMNEKLHRQTRKEDRMKEEQK